MTRWLKIALSILAMLISIGGIFGYIIMYNDKHSLSIIGGEDGPTTIFLAGQLGNENLQTAIEEETQETKDDSTQSINESNDMAEAMNERSSYYQKSAYYDEVSNYLENVLEIRDISNVVEPLYHTDMKYYSADYFEDVPPLMIHIAKNEIYARHGYIFINEDLYNYFMGCIWYNPTCSSSEFDDSVFNQYEKTNLELLAGLDDYK